MPWCSISNHLASTIQSNELMNSSTRIPSSVTHLHLRAPYLPLLSEVWLLRWKLRRLRVSSERGRVREV